MTKADELRLEIENRRTLLDEDEVKGFKKLLANIKYEDDMVKYACDYVSYDLPKNYLQNDGYSKKLKPLFAPVYTSFVAKLAEDGFEVTISPVNGLMVDQSPKIVIYIPEEPAPKRKWWKLFLA